MALIKTNPVFFSGEEREKFEYLKSNGLLKKKKRIVIKPKINIPGPVNNVEKSKKIKITKNKILRSERIYIKGKRDNDKAGFGIVVYWVCIKQGVTLEELKSKSRKEEIVEARNIIAYICQHSCSLSFIGRQLNKNHASVIHMQSKAQYQIKESKEFRNKVESIKIMLPREKPLEEVSMELGHNLEIFNELKNQL